MGFDPQRNSVPRRAIRAGRIALERGSEVIELDDWRQAATSADQPLTQDERDRMKAVSVSDEVIRRVAEGESKSMPEADGGTVSSGNRWMRRPLLPKPNE